jgi:hypothetical protein
MAAAHGFLTSAVTVIVVVVAVVVVVAAVLGIEILIFD